jgi:LemA protein
MTAKRNLELIPPHFRLTPCPNSRRAAARFVFRLVSLSFRPTGVVCHVDRLDRSRHHRHHRAVCAYNRLVALSQRVGQAFADVDVQLKQRHDLIPNLVETVKGYASHERGTLDDVIKARNSAMSAQGPAQVSAAENQLSGALGRLIALSEAYPDLKANANFQQLASELSDLENKIAASRRFFNNAVQEYNTGIQQLPAALFAGMFGFTRKEFFDLGASRTEVEAVPTVKF